MTTSTDLRKLRLEAVAPLSVLRRQIDILLSEISQGVRDIESVVMQQGDSVIDMTYIVKLIEVVPGVGKVGARQLLSTLDLAETEHAGNLTTTERKSIVQLVQSLTVGKA